MLHKILGILDLTTAITFFLNTFLDKTDSWFPNKIVIIMATYLILKGIFFLVSLDFISIIDIICGIIIILSVYISLPVILSTIIIIFLLQKAIFSLIS